MNRMSSEGLPTTRLSDERERWEYRVMLMAVGGFLGPNVDVDQLGQYLNQAGEDGWELMSVVPITRGRGETSELMGVFKRKWR
jgi:esterase/lipase